MFENANPPAALETEEPNQLDETDYGLEPFNTNPEFNIMPEVNPTKNSLSSDVEIKGSITFQTELTIDGKVEGEITSTGVLTLGENAEVRGEIRTKSVTVLGKVHGNITVDERCELKGRAQLFGDLKAARLMIEEGATFVGKSEVTPHKVAAMKPEIVRNSESHPRVVAAAR